MSWIIEFISLVAFKGPWAIISTVILIITSILGAIFGGGGGGGGAECSGGRYCYSTYQEALVACGQYNVGSCVESTPNGGYMCHYCNSKIAAVSDAPYDMGYADGWNDYEFEKNYQESIKNVYSETASVEYARGYEAGWFAAIDRPNQ